MGKRQVFSYQLSIYGLPLIRSLYTRRLDPVCVSTTSTADGRSYTVRKPQPLRSEEVSYTRRRNTVRVSSTRANDGRFHINSAYGLPLIGSLYTRHLDLFNIRYRHNSASLRLSHRHSLIAKASVFTWIYNKYLYT